MSTLGPTPPSVVVLGAGVIGLTTALLLARKGYAVHVVARNLPTDDLDQDWSSPWAGANWCPFGTDPNVCRWETEALAQLRELIPTGLAMELPIRRYAATEAGLHNHWYEPIVKDYRRLPASECPPNSVGVAFTSVSVNSPAYIRWLESQSRALGVTFERRSVKALRDVVRPDTTVVVNATGLGSLTLEDVRDENVEPIRGQIVLVRSNVTRCVMDSSQHDSPTRSTYIIPRPNSGGETICGGCYETGSWDRKPNPKMTREILEHCLRRVPDLSKDGTVEGMEIIRECVGFRPSRRGGPRMEREVAHVNGRKIGFVHAYGIGPAGYQASWGMAGDAVKLVGEACLEREETTEVRARL